MFYISNNSSKSKADYVKRLAKFGLKAKEEQIVLSTDSMIRFLKKMNVSKVFVLGTKSLKQMILDAGIDICSIYPEFVVVGYDTELSYRKLVDTCRLVNKNIDFIATHCDQVCPTEDGPIPDIGLIIEMIEKTTNKNVYKVFGKPNVDLIETIIERYSIPRDEILMIGDRLYTDIAMAVNAEVDSILVLSGDTSRNEVEEQPYSATYVLKNISRIK